ncbi:phosphotransferase family protein [Aspergillus sclerotioniger CBS 115572]|uniref:Phosphotransferase family protein n=1 Tax=Aspergillus sclerotioniger CBS 115572 TaxID=1450535 RepID=A0A317VDN5_9EURO|nr:phosphotransferase family protein [Aspergillus sclerotioniger CBS 115572]PWY72483.1 phosphotransferase family protein [Aspergillus sclerotioniger CBS 115572]
MGSHYIPSILRPDFTWPRPMRCTISRSTPPALYHLSRWYCSWFGIIFDVNILQLPFGLILKWTDRTSLEEAVAMQMARTAGMPVPKVLFCGEHPNAPFNRTFSILMTRLPGVSLENSRYSLEIDDEGPWLHELKTCVDSMRLWCSPNPRSICSPLSTPLRSPRVPGHLMGPFASERELYNHLFSPASSHAFESPAEYERTLSCAEKLQRPYQVVFTHGDFKAHNILVGDDGHLSGFLDWESAGWYPEYWEFTTAMRFGRGSWWFQVASWMGGHQYLEELASDVALNLLTVDSYIAF